MDELMMDFPLTLTHLLRRAEQFFGGGEIVTRLPDMERWNGVRHRLSNADSVKGDCVPTSNQLAREVTASRTG